MTRRWASSVAAVASAGVCAPGCGACFVACLGAGCFLLYVGHSFRNTKRSLGPLFGAAACLEPGADLGSFFGAGFGHSLNNF